jgi:hypothetical protein
MENETQSKLPHSDESIETASSTQQEEEEVMSNDSTASIETPGEENETPSTLSSSVPPKNRKHFGRLVSFDENIQHPGDSTTTTNSICTPNSSGDNTNNTHKNQRAYGRSKSFGEAVIQHQSSLTGTDDNENGTIPSSTNKKQSGFRRAVSFGEINVREFDRVPGDNPACKHGVPLSLDWAYHQKEPIQLDEFETLKDQKLVVPFMLMDGDEDTCPRKLGWFSRKHLLHETFQIPMEEICDAEKAVEQFKKEEADRKLQEEKATAEAATNDNKTKKTKSFKPMKTFKRLFTKKACAVSAC